MLSSTCAPFFAIPRNDSLARFYREGVIAISPPDLTSEQRALAWDIKTGEL
jgi:hypothetical protein